MMKRDWRDDRIAEQDAQIAQLKAELAERDRVIAQLTARVAELEEQLRRSSKNSSRPPSSDRPWLLRGRKKPPSGRKPGGQPSLTHAEPDGREFRISLYSPRPGESTERARRLLRSVTR